METFSIDNNKGWVFIKKDLHTEDGEGEDYLTSPTYNYDILIENPPWGKQVYPFLKKAYQSKKPFAFLLSIEVLIYKRTHNILRKKGAIIHCIIPRPDFMHQGRRVQVGGCIWVVGNYGEIKGLVFGKTMVLRDDEEKDGEEEGGNDDEDLI